MRIDGLRWLPVGLFIVMIATGAFFVSPASGWYGGFFDDGLYDDDWYYDYYAPGSDGRSESNETSQKSETQSGQTGDNKQESAHEYAADEFYTDAAGSGLFDT